MMDDSPSEAQEKNPLLSPWSKAARWARLGVFLGFIGFVAIFILAAPRWESARRYQATNDAYVQSDLTPLNTRVSGYLLRVPTDDYQKFHQGDLVAEIDPADYVIKLHQAQADLQAADAAVQVLYQKETLQKAVIASARAKLLVTESMSHRALLEKNRTATLTRDGAGTQQADEDAQAALEQTSALKLGDSSAIEAALAQLKVLEAEEVGARAAKQRQEAVLAEAQLNLSYTRILAPVTGMSSERLARTGQYVTVGQQITTLVSLPRVWITANFKETQLAHFSIGLPVQIAVDAFPGQKLRGHIASHAPGSGSVFALLPADNATGNFTKVVQRIPVRVEIDDSDNLSEQLTPGMSVVCTVDTRAG